MKNRFSFDCWIFTLLILIPSVSVAHDWDYTYHLSRPGFCNHTDYQVTVQMPECNGNWEKCKIDEAHGIAPGETKTLNKNECASFRIRLDQDIYLNSVNLPFMVFVRKAGTMGYVLDAWEAEVILNVNGKAKVEMLPGKSFDLDFTIDMSHGNDHFHFTVNPKSK